MSAAISLLSVACPAVLSSSDPFSASTEPFSASRSYPGSRKQSIAAREFLERIVVPDSNWLTNLIEMIRRFLACAVVAALSLLGLCKEFEEIAHDANGRVGVAVMLLESRESVELRGDERFPMHSVYKLPIAMAVLRRVDRGELQLDQTVKVEKTDFVRKGMYSPIRDKVPAGSATHNCRVTALRCRRERRHGKRCAVETNRRGTGCDVILERDQRLRR